LKARRETPALNENNRSGFALLKSLSSTSYAVRSNCFSNTKRCSLQQKEQNPKKKKKRIREKRGTTKQAEKRQKEKEKENKTINDQSFFSLC